MPSGIPLTDEQVQAAFNLMADGNSLLKSCRQLGISYSSVMDRVSESPDWAASYAHARERFAHAQVELLHEVADTTANPQIARLKSDNIKWYVGRVLNKVYGERMHHDHDVTPDSPLASLLAGMGRSAIPLASPGRPVIEHEDDDSIPLPSAAGRSSGG